MPDFWQDSGYHLTARDANGQLEPTDEFLRAYLRRPEMLPPEEACDEERALHASLLANPRERVGKERLARLADADGRENWQVWLAFRDRLVSAGTLEGAYLNYFLAPPDLSRGELPVPPLFLDQLAHVITRAILEGVEDPFQVRAGELLFREQRVMIEQEAIMLADAETVDMYASTGGFGSLGRLVAESQTPLRSVDLDVMLPENADIYWQRDSRYDLVLNINFSSPGLDALCRVLEAWVLHFLSAEVSIQPVQSIRDERWVWHLGLDTESTRLLNDLYQDVEVGEERLRRLLSLFRLEFKDPSLMASSIAGRPIYMGLCMTESGLLRLKPQNLLVNLPLAERA